MSQSDAGGSDRKVELKVIPTGLMLSDGGDSVVYNFSNLRAWSAEWGKTLTVKVSAGAGLVTDYSFVTPESVQILRITAERNGRHAAWFLPALVRMRVTVSPARLVLVRA